jgi:hypothetical protein
MKHGDDCQLDENGKCLTHAWGTPAWIALQREVLLSAVARLDRLRMALQADYTMLKLIASLSEEEAFAAGDEMTPPEAVARDAFESAYKNLGAGVDKIRSLITVDLESAS